MNKEKLLPKNPEAQTMARLGRSQELARRTLRRAKEMDLTPEEKEKMMEMIDEAKQFEAKKEQSKALNVYTELMRFLRGREDDRRKEKTLVEYGGFEILYPQVEVLHKIEKIIMETTRGNEEDAKAIILQSGLDIDEDGNIKKIKYLDDSGQFPIDIEKLPKLQLVFGGNYVLYRQFLALQNIEHAFFNIKSASSDFDPVKLRDQLAKGIKVDASGNVISLKIDILSIFNNEEIKLAQRKGFDIPDLILLKNLENLDLNGCGSSRLPYLGSLKNLKVLDIQYNNFKTAPDLSFLENLEVLRCDDCGTMPDLTGLTNLKTLLCQENELTALPDIGHLVKLETLYCGGNKLTSLPDLSVFKNLKEFDCGINELEKLPELSSLKQLVTLGCGSNRLKKLPDLSGLTSLEELDCACNELKILPDLSKLTKLKKVICFNNNLTKKEIKRIINQVPEDCEVIDNDEDY